jgi:Cysteine-rich secretory protein family
MAGKWGILALALLACSASAGTKGQAFKPNPTVKSNPTLAVEEQIWLDTHNMARARYGRTPLIWDEGLERDARVWARQLARTGQFEHATVKGQGENLWMGTRAAFPSHSMVQSWIDEEAFLKSGTFPDVSTSGNWADVGHMTQLLWPTTTHVGCAKASNAADDYLVCRYSPPGNWMGEAFNARRK